MKRKKIHVAFLMGGLSSEREVSLNSGNACYDAIDKEKYYATKIIVDKNFYDQILTNKPDVCFNALHGSFGEDGTIQSFLNKIKIPYTHSGANASSIAMNKLLTKNYLSQFSKNTAEKILKEMNEKLDGKVTTKISKEKNYCKAEGYHQKYEKNKSLKFG